MSDEDDKSLAALNKQLRYFKRRYANAMRELETSEKIRYNYEIFYQSGLKELEEKEIKLDAQRTELIEARNRLTKKNQELALLNEQLEVMALVDALTGLPNRKFFEERLADSISFYQREGLSFALLFIDLDGFKDINDTYGHSTGDILLIEISKRLSSTLREHDILARLGGDEFVVILQSVISVEVAHIADRVIAKCREPVLYEDKILVVSASVGIAMYPDDTVYVSADHHSSHLQQCADLAMYKAKNTGKNQYFFYDNGMAEKAKEELLLGLALRQAIKESKLQPFFQPLYSLENDAVTGLEVLARWPDSNSGSYFMPDEFLPVAKKLNLMPEIDFQILFKACLFLHENQCVLNTIDYISVNFSVETFSEKHCVDRFLSVISQFNIQPEQVMLELTESTFLNEDNVAVENMYKLEKFGVRLALDDFGTGYSALSYLNRVPLDVIKIDRYFVKSLPEDSFSNSVVTHIIALANELHVDVVAEGIETLEQITFLRENGCRTLQGFYFSKPLPEKSVIAFLMGFNCIDRKAVI